MLRAQQGLCEIRRKNLIRCLQAVSYGKTAAKTMIIIIITIINLFQFIKIMYQCFQFAIPTLIIIKKCEFAIQPWLLLYIFTPQIANIALAVIHIFFLMCKVLKKKKKKLLHTLWIQSLYLVSWVYMFV